MTVAPKVERYLADHRTDYEVLAHAPTPSTSETAQATHISGDKLAKAVVLRDGDGFLLAVLPASHHVSLELLQVQRGRPVSLASEQEASDLFPDCDIGAIPPIGQAYGVDVLVDESLAGADPICFEGGDHRSLIRVSGAQFEDLMTEARIGNFSVHD